VDENGFWRVVRYSKNSSVTIVLLRSSGAFGVNAVTLEKSSRPEFRVDGDSYKAEIDPTASVASEKGNPARSAAITLP
jgi:hypothetical protein